MKRDTTSNKIKIPKESLSRNLCNRKELSLLIESLQISRNGNSRLRISIWDKKNRYWNGMRRNSSSTIQSKMKTVESTFLEDNSTISQSSRKERNACASAASTRWWMGKEDNFKRPSRHSMSILMARRWSSPLLVQRTSTTWDSTRCTASLHSKRRGTKWTR